MTNLRVNVGAVTSTPRTGGDSQDKEGSAQMAISPNHNNTKYFKQESSEYLNGNDCMIEEGKQIRVTKEGRDTDLLPNQLQLLFCLNDDFLHGIRSII
ncbi:hypothetical protein C4D60_Mb04t09150 [Musa balbisiana]|uniref:Uncharacterized protein n=1 Tax=Musa balbisiana TaxID=52838 RepID=A0A4S8KAP6_MUSBA|nr:hypothetical protein C4D60_Mb04t09150 [Musa balbisiana]